MGAVSTLLGRTSAAPTLLWKTLAASTVVEWTSTVRMTADRLDALGNGFLTVAFLAVDAACARFGPVLKPSSGHCLDDCVLRWAHGPALRLRVTHSKPS